MLELFGQVVLFLLGFRRVYFTGELTVTDTARPLGDEIDLLQISLENPSLNNDGSQSEVEIFYGDKTRQRRNLRPGFNTEWIPVSEARQLYARTISPGQTTTITYSGIRIIKR